LHGEWLGRHFGVKVRVFDGYGPIGAGVIIHAEYIEELIGPGSRNTASD